MHHGHSTPHYHTQHNKSTANNTEYDQSQELTSFLLLTAALLLLLTLALLLLLLTGGAAAAGVGCGSLLVLCAAALHHGLLQLVRRSREVVLRDVRVLHRLAQLRHQRLHVLLLRIAHVLPLAQLPLRCCQLRLGVVAHLHKLALHTVRLRVLLRVADHLLDLILRQPAVRRDRDVLRLARRLVLRRHVADAVCVNVERHLHLRHAAGGGRDAHQVELTHHLVVRRHLALALEHLDPNLRLVVRCRRERLALLRRDRRVLRDHAREHAAERLNAQRQRRHVQQHKPLHVAAQHAAQRRGTKRHGLVGVHAAEWVLLEELLHLLHHLRHARHPAHKHNIVDLLQLHASVLHALLARRNRPLDQLLHNALELATADVHLDVLRAVSVRSDERQVHLRLHRRRKLALRLLRSLAHALQRHPLLAQVDPARLAELLQDVVRQRQVEVLAAKVRVAVRRLHLEHAASDLQHGDIERAAAKVVHRDHAVLRLVHAVRKRRCCRLVHHADHVQARDRPGVLRRLALRVVEVRGARHHRVAHLVPHEVLRRLLHLLQHERADLRRRVLLPVPVLHPRVAVPGAHDLVRHVLDVLLDVLVLEPAPDQPLHRIERRLRVRDRLPLRR
ncbi:heat shock 70-related protein 1, mitochondrial precursor, putative [Leishmania tarentolae]|uniref:Heat shock 70-related protein 1, mitochondrial, putative n=1 Tax=Leishmania tarentolae TaxID=5689 RepID=A0A640KP70_LEITA|nr:heat shock 70-related protein 1, mitochondrial precursor, putative [Leishmania tarentolae]